MFTDIEDLSNEGTIELTDMSRGNILYALLINYILL